MKISSLDAMLTFPSVPNFKGFFLCNGKKFWFKNWTISSLLVMEMSFAEAKLNAKFNLGWISTVTLHSSEEETCSWSTCMGAFTFPLFFPCLKRLLKIERSRNCLGKLSKVWREGFKTVITCGLPRLAREGKFGSKYTSFNAKLNGESWKNQGECNWKILFLNCWDFVYWSHDWHMSHH